MVQNIAIRTGLAVSQRRNGHDGLSRWLSSGQLRGKKLAVDEKWRYRKVACICAVRDLSFRKRHLSFSTRGERLKKGSFVLACLVPERPTQTDKLRSRGCTMRVFKIYVKSVLSGLATLFVALLLAAIILIPRSWIAGVDGRSALVFSFLVFAMGFCWQYRRLSHKRST